MKEPLRDENVLRSHVSCLQIFEEDKYLNLLFGFILQYGYRSEGKKSEIGLCILYWGEKRQIKMDTLFNNIEGQELVNKWVHIIKQVQERRQSNSSASTSTSTTTNLAKQTPVAGNEAAQAPTAGIRATKKARLEFMSPTMCYSCVVNLCDRRKAQLKSIVLQFARSMFPREDNGVDAFEQMHQLVQAVPEQDKLMGAMQTLYNKGDKLAQKQIGAALRQQGYQHGEVQTILGCHINKRKFGIFGSPNECVRGSPNKSMPRRLQYTSVVVDQFVKYLIESGYKTAQARTVKKTGSNEALAVAVVYRKYNIDRLIKEFRELRRNLPENLPIHGCTQSLSKRRRAQRPVGLKYNTMVRIIGIVCPQVLKVLAALDGTSEVHGRENFNNLRNLVRHDEALLKRIDRLIYKNRLLYRSFVSYLSINNTQD
jgi:hypothetical protein